MTELGNEMGVGKDIRVRELFAQIRHNADAAAELFFFDSFVYFVLKI